jgi:hypothetical protein
MSIRILLLIETALHMADYLIPSSADITESVSLNFPEHFMPHRPVVGLLYLYLYLFPTTELKHITKSDNNDIWRGML